MIVYASDRPVRDIVARSFRKGALTAMWQTGNALVTERRTRHGSMRTIISQR